MRSPLLFLILALPLTLAAEPKLALFGPFPEDKSVETEAAQKAVDAYNSGSLGLSAKAAAPEPSGPRLRLAVFNTGPGEIQALEQAKHVADDRDVLAVVVHGDAGVSPAVLKVFGEAHLAVVSASSWAQPRRATDSVTWLSPGLIDLAETAALYARREAETEQYRGKKAAPKLVAVVDDGAATSTAAAKAFAARYRALGGKVLVETSWTGEAQDLSPSIRILAAQWPQLIFYAGGAESAGRLVLAMKGEKALKNAALIGLPPLFEPAFFNTTRVKGSYTRAVFPCTDYDGMRNLALTLGFAFPMTSPEFKTYYQYANRRPGRWTSMLFDGVALAARAVRVAALGLPPQASAGPGTATAQSATGQSAALASLGSGAGTPVANPSAVTAPSAALTQDAGTSATAEAQAAAAESPSAPQLNRDTVRQALLAIDAYRGIRGSVKFSATREPTEAKAMVYFALSHVGRKDMYWKQKAYGPPFSQTNH